jgi:DNA-binding response OmpR family regulator
MSGTAAQAPSRTHTVLVYSDDPKVRDTVRTALGRRPAPDLGRVEYVEAAQGDELVRIVDKGGVDLVILDGEAWPAGGMGLSKQMKDELPDCPPTLVLIARKDDRWLATWSLADEVLPHPVDAFALVAAATKLLRAREARLPVRRVVGR